jgi:hypothetical protein
MICFAACALDLAAFVHYSHSPMSMTIEPPLRLTSYLEQLHALAILAGADLLKAFLAAGLPSSTYYRAINGTELRYDTATKVASVLRSQLKKSGASHVAQGTETARSRKHALC